jgi:hypothetical protein
VALLHDQLALAIVFGEERAPFPFFLALNDVVIRQDQAVLAVNEGARPGNDRSVRQQAKDLRLQTGHHQPVRKPARLSDRPGKSAASRKRTLESRIGFPARC